MGTGARKVYGARAVRAMQTNSRTARAYLGQQFCAVLNGGWCAPTDGFITAGLWWEIRAVE